MSATIGLGVSAQPPIPQNPVASPTAPTAETNKKLIDENIKAIEKNEEAIESNTTAIEKNEKLLNKIDDRTETDHMAIEGLKNNKADAEKTKKALEENKQTINDEVKNRKSADRILNEDIEANKSAIAENKTAIAENKTAIAEAQKLLDKVDDRSETDHMAIEGLKNNKADAEKTKKALEENKQTINDEVKNRKSADRILNKDIEANKSAIAENKTAIEETKKTVEDLDVTAGKKGIEANKKAIDLNAAKIASMDVDTQKGIAKATALAGLHPIDMNDGDKLSFAVAAGTYKDETAIAAGAFYRPNRNMLLSFASTLENEDQAYNVGLSFKFGKEGKVEEKTADVEQLYKLIGELQAKLAQQQAEIDALKK